MTRERTLVVVTGAGRSGTSTITGTLARLGFVVPQPEIRASEANPRGFYESWWPVHLHNRLLDRAALAKSDGQPAAADLAAAAVRATDRERLRTWLAEQFAQDDLVVVKDPRAAIFSTLWAEAAEAIGVRIGFVAMLRHPSEVVASRATHYLATSSGVSQEQATRVATGWLNHNLTLERQTRTAARALVRYVDLLTDWRSVLGDMDAALGLSLVETAADPTVAAEIDAFVEPTLRRHESTWDGLDVPEPVVEIAEDVWSALGQLAGTAGDSALAEQRLDAASSRYAELYAGAAALTSHRTASLVEKAARRGRREGRQEAATEQAAAPVAAPPAASPPGRLTVRARRWVARVRRGGAT